MNGTWFTQQSAMGKGTADPPATADGSDLMALPLLDSVTYAAYKHNWKTW